MRCANDQTNPVAKMIVTSTGASVAGSTMVAYHAGNSSAFGAGYEVFMTNFRITAKQSYSVELLLANNASTQAGTYSANFDKVQLWSVTDPNPLAQTSATIVQNGSFESPGTGLPTSWSGTGTSTSMLEQFSEGKVGLALTTTSSNPLVTQGNLPNMTISGQSYIMTYWGRITNPNNQAEIGVRDVTTSRGMSHSIVTSTTGASRSFSLGSIPGNPTDDIEIDLYNLPASTTSLAYFDNISIVPAYSTLPVAGWTTTGNVVATNAGGNSGNGFVVTCAKLTGNGASMSQDILNFTPDSGYGATIVAQTSDANTTALVEFQDNGTTFASFPISNGDGSVSFTSYPFFPFTTPALGHRLTEKITVTTSTNGSVYCYGNTVAEQWPQQVHEGILGGIMLQFANLVYTNPQLQSMMWNGNSFLVLADQYTNFAASYLFTKWNNSSSDIYWHQLTGTLDGNNGTGTYSFPLGTSTTFYTGRSLPYNQNMAYAVMLYDLYQAETLYNQRFPGTYSQTVLDQE